MEMPIRDRGRRSEDGDRKAEGRSQFDCRFFIADWSKSPGTEWTRTGSVFFTRRKAFELLYQGLDQEVEMQPIRLSLFVCWNPRIAWVLLKDGCYLVWLDRSSFYVGFLQALVIQPSHYHLIQLLHNHINRATHHLKDSARDWHQNPFPQFL